MRTNPLNESWAFLTGTSSFHQEAGFQSIFMVPLFYILLAAGIWIVHFQVDLPVASPKRPTATQGGALAAGQAAANAAGASGP